MIYDIIVTNTLYTYKHTRSHYAVSSTQQVHSQQQSKIRHGQDKHRQANTLYIYFNKHIGNIYIYISYILFHVFCAHALLSRSSS
jgi:hypothetical protein